MTQTKSIFAGLAAVILVFVIVPVFSAVVRILIFLVKHGGNGFEIGFSRLRWVGLSPAIWFAAAVIFVIGYLWELRRLAR